MCLAPYLVGEAAGYDTSKPNERSGEKKTVVVYSSFARDLSSSGEMVVLVRTEKCAMKAS